MICINQAFLAIAKWLIQTFWIFSHFTIQTKSHICFSTKIDHVFFIIISEWEVLGQVMSVNRSTVNSLSIPQPSKN